jgi:hypothetical protein
MTSPNQPAGPDFETRLDALLAAQPVKPPTDFVARTMARIRAEADLTACARAGDEAAIDELLDRWLGEQPLEPEFEPAQLAIHTRREATREEDEENRPIEAPWRRLIAFPAWARAASTLAAAAAVALVAYFGTYEKSSHVSSGSIARQPAEESANVATEEPSLPSTFDVAYDASSLPNLDDSLKDGAALVEPDSVAFLADAVSQNDGTLDGLDSTSSTDETPQ